MTEDWEFEYSAATFAGFSGRFFIEVEMSTATRRESHQGLFFHLNYSWSNSLEPIYTILDQNRAGANSLMAHKA